MEQPPIPSQTLSAHFWLQANELQSRMQTRPSSNYSRLLPAPLPHLRPVLQKPAKPLDSTATNQFKPGVHSCFDFEHFGITSSNRPSSVVRRHTPLTANVVRDPFTRIPPHQNNPDFNSALPIPLYRINRNGIYAKDIERHLHQQSRAKERGQSAVSKTHPNKTAAKNSNSRQDSASVFGSHPAKTVSSQTRAPSALSLAPQVQSLQLAKAPRPVTAAAFTLKQATGQFKKKAGSAYQRPPSAVNSRVRAVALFSGQSKISDLQSHPPQQLEEDPLFDTNEPTHFVSFIVRKSSDWTRPSERIGAYMQFGQRLRFDHLREVQVAFQGTTLIRTRDLEMPIQNALVDPNVLDLPQKGKGILFYSPFDKLLGAACFSLFPEFVDDELVEFYRAQTKPGLLDPRQSRREFDNRDRLARWWRTQMKGTYDPSVIIEVFWKNRFALTTKMDLKAAAEATVEFQKFRSRQQRFLCNKYIPSVFLCPFRNIWTTEILKRVAQNGKFADEQSLVKLMTEIRSDCTDSQRAFILEYLLRSPAERDRLSIQSIKHDPPTSSQILASFGGYHSGIFPSWSQLVKSARSFLGTEEILYNCRSLAIQNWIAHFRKLPLFETQFIGGLVSAGCSVSVKAFVSHQLLHLDLVHSVLEHIFKRGLLCLIDLDFYLKGEDQSDWAEFDLWDGSGAFFARVPSSPDIVTAFLEAKESPSRLSQVEDNLAEAYIMGIESCWESQNSQHESQVVLKPKPISASQRVAPVPLEIKGRLLKAVSLILEDFLREKMEESCAAFREFFSNFATGRNSEGVFQPLFSLGLEHNGDYSFSESVESIQEAIQAFFRRAVDVLASLSNFGDLEAVVAFPDSDRDQEKPRPNACSRRGVAFDDLSKIDKSAFRNIFGQRCSEFLGQVKLTDRVKEISRVLLEVRQIPLPSTTTFLNRPKVIDELLPFAERALEPIFGLVESEYRRSAEAAAPLRSFTPMLGKDARAIAGLVFPHKKPYYPALVNELVSTLVGEEVDRENWAKEKLNCDEITCFKDNLVTMQRALVAVPRNTHLSLFKVKRASLLQRMLGVTEALQASLRGRLLDRLVVNTRQLLGVYGQMTRSLRMEVTCSGDYAAFRSLAFEAVQEKTVLLRKSKETFEEALFSLGTKALDVRERELLPTLTELSLADKLFATEIERNTERVGFTRGEFERKLREDKLCFQSECDDLTSRVQVYKNLSDWRNCSTNYEELRQLESDLRALHARHLDIDRQERDLYERPFRADFDHLDEVVMPSLEVWQFAHESLAQGKRVMGTPVLQITIAEMEAFVNSTTQRIAELLGQQYMDRMENLRVVLLDVQGELAEVIGMKPLVETICQSGLGVEDWKHIIKVMNADTSPENFTLRALLSFLTDENRASFDVVCQRATYNRTLKTRLNDLTVKFDALNLLIDHSDSVASVSNLPEAKHEIGLLVRECQELLETTSGHPLEVPTAELGEYLQVYKQFISLVELFQRLYIQIREAFRGVEYSVDIDSEYRQFYQVGQFHDELFQHLAEEGLGFVRSHRTLREDLKRQIAVVEVILNHKRPVKRGLK